MKERDLVKHLRSHGCELHHHGSRHDYWLNTAKGNRSPVPRHREIKTRTVRAICDQLDIPRPAKL